MVRLESVFLGLTLGLIGFDTVITILHSLVLLAICVLVCLFNFLPPFLLYFLFSLCCLIYLFIFLVVYLLTYLSTPSKIDPFCFQAGGRRGRPKVVLVFCVYSML